MSYIFRNPHNIECVGCGKAISFTNTDFICDSCKSKQNLIKTLGWASVVGFSLFFPHLAGAAAEARKWVEEAFVGNPSEKKIYELHNQIKMLHIGLKLKELEYSNLEGRIKHLEESNRHLQKAIEEEKLIRDLYHTVNNPWHRIAENPKHFGVWGLEQVNISTRLEYLDYPLLIDIFIPDPEGKGLLHGGIPVEVISSMIIESKIRRPMLYSYKPKELSQPVDRIY